MKFFGHHDYGMIHPSMKKRRLNPFILLLAEHSINGQAQMNHSYQQDESSKMGLIIGLINFSEQLVAKKVKYIGCLRPD